MMVRIDIAKLRKEAGMSQRELAEKLNIKPSFLSAIENGRSRLPEGQLEKIKQIFRLQDLNGYIVTEQSKDTANSAVPPHSHFGDEGSAIALFLQHIHNQAHQDTVNHSDREAILEQRVDYLSERNDSLSARVDELRNQLDALRDENYRLKLLLASNGITTD